MRIWFLYDELFSEYFGTWIRDKAQKRVENYDRIQGENMERVQESAMNVFGNQLTILATDFLSRRGLTSRSVDP